MTPGMNNVLIGRLGDIDMEASPKQVLCLLRLARLTQWFSLLRNLSDWLHYVNQVGFYLSLFLTLGLCYETLPVRSQNC